MQWGSIKAKTDCQRERKGQTDGQIDKQTMADTFSRIRTFMLNRLLV